MITALIGNNECCGCQACENVCPNNAITMRPDKIGFMHPYVDFNICSRCGLCNKTCPVINENEERIPQYVYAVKNKDIDVRLDSSSGGVFSIFAEEFLESGGVVYGAMFDEEWNVVHTRIYKKADIKKLRGSKYVQSSLADTFINIKSDLKNGVRVLFTGTPCQVSGLLKFIGKKNVNLTTLDFVCHGVPNPAIWNDYLCEISNKNKSNISNISFRNKTDGWINYRIRIDFENVNTTEINEHSSDNDYMQLFLKDYILRPSCHNCRFRNGKSGSNYTMGDYWCVEKFYPHFFDDHGVSLLLCYDGCMPDFLKAKVDAVETRYKDACYGNICISSNWPYNPLSRLFYFLHNYLRFTIKDSLNITKYIGRRCVMMKSYKQQTIYNLKKICRKLVC